MPAYYHMLTFCFIFFRLAWKHFENRQCLVNVAGPAPVIENAEQTTVRE
jgi:hypothetical protein